MGRVRTYTMEFKKQAVELGMELRSCSKAAEKLGIPEANIHAWRVKFLKTGAVEEKKTSSSPEQLEIRALRKEIADLKQANFILKSAAAFFSQDHLKKNFN